MTFLILWVLKGRQESYLYNPDVHCCIHYPIKNADFSSSMPSYSSPYMNLDGMLTQNCHEGENEPIQDAFLCLPDE